MKRMKKTKDYLGQVQKARLGMFNLPTYDCHIAKFRKKMKISLRELARRAIVSSGYLSQLENGFKKPTVLTAARIAAHLDCAWNDLWPDLCTRFTSGRLFWKVKDGSHE